MTELSNKVLALFLPCPIFQQHMEITEKRFMVINLHPISTRHTNPNWCTHTAIALALGNNGREGEEKGGRVCQRRKSRKT